MSVMLQPSFPFKRTVLVCCASSQQSDARVPELTKVRFGLPSKGCMATDTLKLLKACQLPVNRENPRQYSAQIPQLADLEVWFQRPKDIVRRLISTDLDLGIVGFDTVSEYGQVVGSGVLVSPLNNIFNEETPRLYELLRKLGL